MAAFATTVPVVARAQAVAGSSAVCTKPSKVAIKNTFAAPEKKSFFGASSIKFEAKAAAPAVFRVAAECHSDHVPCLVGQTTPAWTAQAVKDQEFVTLSDKDFRGKYSVLFFYPLDFTFVCPTEIIAFSDRYDDFKKINCEVAAVSVDSVYTHLAWVQTPRSEGGLGDMKIPIIADLTKDMSKKFGVLFEKEGISFRGLFVISPEGVIRHITINDLPVGRNVDEVLRIVQAFQYADSHDDEVCPAGWTPGDKTMVPDPEKKKDWFKALN
eukprot:tig00020848_g14561.t1